MQQRLDRAQTADEKDFIYAEYATALAGKGDARARELVDKIEDSDTRKSVRVYTDFQLAERAVQNKDATEAARLVKTGYAPGANSVREETRGQVGMQVRMINYPPLNACQKEIKLRHERIVS